MHTKYTHISARFQNHTPCMRADLSYEHVVVHTDLDCACCYALCVATRRLPTAALSHMPLLYLSWRFVRICKLHGNIVIAFTTQELNEQAPGSLPDAQPFHRYDRYGFALNVVRKCLIFTDILSCYILYQKALPRHLRNPSHRPPHMRSGCSAVG
jgi:hypothetical protein